MEASGRDLSVDQDISDKLNALSLKCEPALYILGGLPRNEGKRMDRLTFGDNDERVNWVSKCPMNTSRRYFGATVVNGLIYVVGGRGENLIHDSIECYNPKTNKWTTIPGIRPQYKRSEFGLAAIDEQIYLVGGYGDSNRKFECFDVKLNTMSELKEMSRGRWALGVVACHGRIYVCGGQWYNYKNPESQYQTTVYFNDVESYNPITRDWKREEGMLRRRGYFGLTVHDHFLYAVGGMGGECNQRRNRRLDSIERFDTYTGQWTMITTCLEGGISNLGAAVLHSKLLVLGGNRDKTSADQPGDNILGSMQIVDLNKLGSDGNVQTELLSCQRHSFSIAVV